MESQRKTRIDMISFDVHQLSATLLHTTPPLQTSKLIHEESSKTGEQNTPFNGAGHSLNARSWSLLSFQKTTGFPHSPPQELHSS